MEYEETRKTKESEIFASVSEEEKECEINMGRMFLDHMAETIAFRGNLCVKLSVKNREKLLEHVIAEDCGITLGKAFQKMLKEKMNETGIEGSGSAIGIIDEALATAAVSVEGRVGAFIDLECEGAKSALVEDMQSCNLIAFLEGFSQGCRCTIQIIAEKGRDPHHVWEAVFRAFGEALGKTLQKNGRRKGRIVGLKGTMD